MDRAYQPASPTGTAKPASSASGVRTDGRTRGIISPAEREKNRRDAHRTQRARTERLLKQRDEREEFETFHSLSFPSHGVIDHVRLSLRHPIVKLDRARLEAAGFEPERVEMRAKRGPAGHVYDAEPGEELLVRSSDGCRILIWPERVAVIASLSRVLGMTNDRLHEVSERASLAAISTLTELFHWTTRKASFGGEEWAVAEIALTIDVPCDARVYAEAYKSARWKRTNKLPKRFPRGLAWGRWGNRLTLYDKGWEMMRRGIENPPPPGAVMRVERQIRDRGPLSRLAAKIAHGRGSVSIPMLHAHPRGGVVPLSTPIENRILHEALAGDLADLDQPMPLGGGLSAAIATHMAECHRFEDLVRLHSDPKTYRNYRQRVLDLRLGRDQLPTLLQLCYGVDRGPRRLSDRNRVSPF